MIASAEGRYFLVHQGRALFAEVAVEVERSAPVPGIECRCSGAGFTGQGHIEDAPAVGYDDWKEGARAGVMFALSVARVPAARVVVSRITGLTTDTNPAAVSAAAARAVWKALQFEPPKEAIEQVEHVVPRSRGRPPDEVPQFD